MSIKNNAVAILGAGAWGTALAILLLRNGNKVKLWSNNVEHVAHMQKYRENQHHLPGIPLPAALILENDLSRCLQAVDDVLVVVPSYAFAEVIQQIKPFLSSQARIAWGTKGLEPKTGKLLHQIVAEILGENTPVASLSGPSFAHEVALGLPTAISLSGNHPTWVRDLITRLHGEHFRVYENSDLIGVQLCGVIKNILAIGVGISDGLQLGANARSALITRGLAEMSRFIANFGASSSTIMSLAGIGDLVLTCTDNQSRNRRLGLAIGGGVSVDQAQSTIGGSIEGLTNTRTVWRLAEQRHIQMPITEQVYKILFESFSPKRAVSQLLDRELRIEVDSP